ncbi:MAG: PAS domain-containing protein [Euryarchaeota archaeon]|nr:PAS domain-containing protein [Euryarchaeota archaeon]
MKEDNPINIDPSKQKGELEAKISRAKNDLQSIFDGITDGIAFIDRDRRIKRVNNALLQLFGKESYHDFLDKKCCEVFYESDAECVDCIANKVYKTGEKHSSLRTINHERLKGRVFQLTAFPLRSDNEGVYGIVECYRDVTKNINMERQLMELEKARNMRYLAAGIAHELRNPLAVISSSAQLCLAELEKTGSTALADDLKENLGSILNNTKSADLTIKQLLDFAKPIKTNFEISQIQSVIDGVCKLVKNRCRKKEINLIKNISNDLPEIRLDFSALTQALLNFISNAVDAVPVGGKVAVETFYRQEEDCVFILVKDTGKGVPPVMSEHLFEPFYTTKENGVGLGMSIAQRIIDAHGGNVEFESIEDEGTTVTIKLPVIESLAGVGVLKS